MKASDPVSKAFELSNKLCSRQSKIMEIPYSAPLYKPLIKSMSFDQNIMNNAIEGFLRSGPGIQGMGPGMFSSWPRYAG